jgi:hypothetical protein
MQEPTGRIILNTQAHFLILCLMDLAIALVKSPSCDGLSGDIYLECLICCLRLERGELLESSPLMICFGLIVL